ncbi:MAG: hypothetical protein ACO265_04710 [Polynucleobacter sp.]
MPAVAVGAVGVPVNAGDASGAAPSAVNAASAVVDAVPPRAIDVTRSPTISTPLSHPR